MSSEPPGLSPAPEGAVGKDFRLLDHLMSTLPEETVRQLHLGLATRLALPSSSHRRRERLAVLLDFLAAHQRPPTADEYRRAAAKLAARGHSAVPLSTLESYYGSYSAAVDWAVKLYVRGTAARAQGGARVVRPPFYWTYPSCLDALDAVRDVLGHDPSANEFAALRRASDALRAATDHDGLTLPGAKPVERLFGSFGELVQAAKRRRDDQQATAAARRAGATTNDRPSQPRRRRQRSQGVSVPRRSPVG